MATAIFNGDFVKVVAAETVRLKKDTGTATWNHLWNFYGMLYTDPTTGQKTFSHNGLHRMQQQMQWLM